MLNKKFLGLAGIAVAAGVLGSLVKPAAATPATLGFYPSTDIYDKGTFHLDVDSYGRGIKADAVVSTGLTYGLGNKDGLFGRSEIGADYILSAGGSVPIDSQSGTTLTGSKRFLGNFKTQLYNNDDSGVRIVAGAWLLGSREVFAGNVGYVLGAKTFKFGRVHAGLAHSFADKETIATLDGDDDRTFLQLGFDRYLTKKLQFAVDYYSGKSAISGIQPTLYYYINDRANFGVGYFRANDKDIAPTRNQIYLCFDYNFGGASGISAEPEAPIKETEPDAPASN